MPALVACGLALMPDAGLAGAWTLPEGEGQLIMTTARKAPQGQLFDGVSPEATNITRVFVEYGAFDGVTVGVTGFADISAADASTGRAVDLEAGLGAHLRYRIYSGDSWVVSVQGGVSAPIERWFGAGLGDDVPNSVTEIDLRVLYGHGWQWDLGNSFVSAESGLRIRGEGQPEELRFDVTAGHEPVKGLLGLMSVFASVPLGDGDVVEADRGEASLKLSPSIAYTLWPWLGDNDKKPSEPLYPDTVQVGVTWDALQPEEGLEIGVSIWKRF